MAAATGGSLALLRTRTVTVALSLSLPSTSLTVSPNSRLVGCPTCGATKSGVDVVALDSVRGGVPVRYSHEYVRVSPLGSEDPEPSSVTVAPSSASRRPVATATGSSDSLSVTVIITDALFSSLPLLTISVKVSGVSSFTTGVVNDAVSSLIDRLTAGVPAVWLHVYVRVMPLGSEEPEPSSVTEVFSLAPLLLPPAMLAIGASLVLSRTVMTTSSVSDPPRESVTFSVNVRSWSDKTAGVVNEAVAVVLPESVTEGVPAVWLHSYVRVSPGLSSDEPLPSSVTVVPPSSKVPPKPASAFGSSLMSSVIWTVAVSVAIPLLPSVTVSLNSSVRFSNTVGEVNVGEAVLAADRVTVCPVPTCTQEYDRMSGTPTTTSGSEEPEPSSVTVMPSPWGPYVPASAVGVWFTSSTVIVRSFVPEIPEPSVALTVTSCTPSCDSEGVQEKAPAPVMAAPSGAPAPSENVRVSGVPPMMSTSEAVAVNVNSVPSPSSMSGIAPSTGA